MFRQVLTLHSDNHMKQITRQGNVCIKVKLRRVRVTVVAMGKQ
jgi:hypothetical protein